MAIIDIKRLRQLENKDRGKGLSEKEHLEMDTLMEELAAKQRAALPLPTCCEAAKNYPTITFGVNSDTGVGKWYAQLYRELTQYLSLKEGWWDNMPDPKFCPYCGTGLPNMVRKNPVPEDICTITDGGYYCDTCKERLQSCICLPPEAAFEQEK
jgi:hypothetical protein